MKIAWGCDHAGVWLKNQLIAYMDEKGYENIDYGNYDENDRTDDYPVYGLKVAEAIKDGEAEKGVLICGTGLGISLVANKVPGILAGHCSDPYTARMAREHNNVDIIAFGARVIGLDLAKMLLDEFFGREFQGGRHQRRLDMIEAVERKYNKENPEE